MKNLKEENSFCFVFIHIYYYQDKSGVDSPTMEVFTQVNTPLKINTPNTSTENPISSNQENVSQP